VHCIGDQLLYQPQNCVAVCIAPLLLLCRFRLTGWLRGLHVSLVLAAAAAAAIPLFQLNARLAEQSLPDAGGPIAPHEWLGELVVLRGFQGLGVSSPNPWQQQQQQHKVKQEQKQLNGKTDAVTLTHSRCTAV
jgi:hypothetical protein